MQPPWLNVPMLDFESPSDIGHGSEMEAGVFAPRSKTAAYAPIRGIPHAGQVAARALGGTWSGLPGTGARRRLGPGDRAGARDDLLGRGRPRHRSPRARRVGHQGDADRGDRGPGRDTRLLGPPTRRAGADTAERPGGEA